MTKRCGWLVVSMLAASPTACGGERSPTEECLELKPGTASGVYGCATSINDVGRDRKPQVLADFGVQVFAEEPPRTPNDGLTPLASTKSNSLGFYELALAPGSYSLCTTDRSCTAIEIRANEPLRKNYLSSFGGAGW